MQSKASEVMADVCCFPHPTPLHILTLRRRSVRTLVGFETKLLSKLSTGKLSQAEFKASMNSSKVLATDKDSDKIGLFAPKQPSIQVQPFNRQCNTLYHYTMYQYTVYHYIAYSLPAHIQRWPESEFCRGTSRKEQARRRQLPFGPSASIRRGQSLNTQRILRGASPQVPPWQVSSNASSQGQSLNGSMNATALSRVHTARLRYSQHPTRPIRPKQNAVIRAATAGSRRRLRSLKQLEVQDDA
jgi:hypothetical protein